MLWRELKIKTTRLHGAPWIPSLFIWLVRLCECVADGHFLCVSENWQSGPENHARGVAWLDKIYQHNRTGTMNSLAAHKDFGKKPLTYVYLYL